jgi:filamentous hemagglutinin family protein
MLFAALLGPIPIVYAHTPAPLPTDPTVVHGSAAFHTIGDHMTVTSSPGTILDWQSFSIGADHGVYFQQPDAASQVLNRVVGDDPSQILGSLGSNGGVWLINSHGVLFGQNARIDVAGLVASTLDISNIDFLAGRYNFISAGSQAGQVANQGDIRTSFGGRVWLLGGQVRNEGVIQTPGGHIVLAAGKSLELVDSGAPNVIVRVTAPQNEVANLGSLVSASGGTVDLHASIVNQQGIVRADSVGTDEAGRIVLKASQALNVAENSIIRAQGGSIAMSAGNTTYLAGLVDVSKAAGTGGSIRLVTGRLEGTTRGSLLADGEQGGHIRVEGSRMVGFSSRLSATGSVQGGTVDVTGSSVFLLDADVDASGGARGGAIHLGGDWQRGGSLPHAKEVLIGVGSEIRANGGTNGNISGKGGEIAIWSTQSSQHYGLLQALNGGRIEFSSRGKINYQGEIQAGIGGQVLFDPKNIIIRTPQHQPPSLLPTGESSLFDDTPSLDSVIAPASITALLDKGSTVTLQANNDISVLSNILTYAGTVEIPNHGGNLFLQAGRYITFGPNVGISTANGNLTVVAGGEGPDNTYKDTGIATITISSGVSLDVGTGTAILAAVKGEFKNNSGLPVQISEGGRWLVYAADPETSNRGFASSNDPEFPSFNYQKRYGESYSPGSTFAESGNWFLYSVTPTLFVKPSDTAITYGTSFIDYIYSPQYRGLIDGDSVATATNNANPQDISWNDGGRSTSGFHLAGTHDVSYVSGLSSSLGYQIKDDPLVGPELLVSQKEITATNVEVNNKIYNSNTDASLSRGSLSGVVSFNGVSDLVNLSATFDNKNAQIDKPVRLGLSGTDSANYILAPSSPVPVATIFAKPLTANGFTALNKVCDGTASAQVSGGSLLGVVLGDAVSLSGANGAFDNKNAGIDKIVTVSGISLSGIDSANYIINGTPTTTADIFPKTLIFGTDITGITAQNKTYDSTTAATLIGGSLLGVVVGDSVAVASLIGTFDNKNVGIGKTVTISGGTLSGGDANNYNIAGTGTTTADITKAPLPYVANPIQAVAGGPIGGLTGVVDSSALKGTDTLQGETDGTLTWTTVAGPNSFPGIYAVTGSGLTSANYDLVQAPGNATALTLLDGHSPNINPPAAQDTVHTAVQTLNVAMLGAFPIIDRSTIGYLADMTSKAPSFGSLNLSRMNWVDMQQLIDMRREFKEKLFADAIYKLEQDPSLANVQPCPSLADIDTGLCRITDAQRLELASKAAAEELHKGPRRAKIARLPQIERKFVVLFGIDQYADKTIPPLENAVFDAETLGKLFADKLGYEARVVKNATKADIVRTLNQLAAEMKPHDSVIIYYAGHGYRNDETIGGYWIPSDASVSDPATWISNTDVSGMLREISANQIVMIADSCYSGNFAEQKFRAQASLGADQLLARRTVVMMSSGGDEPVADEGRGGHSIFAWDLMQALRNVDNWRPGTNIFEEVRREVMRSFPQTPQYGSIKSAGHQSGGDYLFEFRELE